TVAVGNGEKYLSRAMGFDEKVEVDLRRLALEVGDVFMLSTDGGHDFVPETMLQEVLQRASEGDSSRLGSLCYELIEAARALGSSDNLTCQLARVDALADATADEYLQHLTRLPFPPELEVGSVLDGFQVLSVLHESSRSQLYLVRAPRSERQLVMK